MSFNVYHPGVSDETAVETALASVRSLVQADGGDMALVGVDGADGTVHLRLVLDGVDCHECVMPRSLLEDIVTNLMRRSVPDVLRVTIDDPREHPDYVPPDSH
jgi:Fe-S cluster biogenesis protein NfuA